MVEHTWKQTHKTHKLTVNIHRNKLPPKQKLTSISGHLRGGIGRIPNIIRYPFFSCEFVSLQCLTMCEEKKGKGKDSTRMAYGKLTKLTKLTNAYRQRDRHD